MSFEKQFQWTCRPLNKFWVNQCCNCNCTQEVYSQYIKSETVGDTQVDYYACKKPNLYPQMIIARFGDGDGATLWIYAGSDLHGDPYYPRGSHDIKAAMVKVQREYYGLQ